MSKQSVYNVLTEEFQISTFSTLFKARGGGGEWGLILVSQPCCGLDWVTCFQRTEYKIGENINNTVEKPGKCYVGNQDYIMSDITLIVYIPDTMWEYLFISMAVFFQAHNSSLIMGKKKLKQNKTETQKTQVEGHFTKYLARTPQDCQGHGK